MRKIIAVFIVCLMLLIPLSSCAKDTTTKLKEQGFEISLSDSWQVANRNVKENNPMVAISSMTKDEYVKYLEDNNFYLEAIEREHNAYLSLACEDVDPQVWGESFEGISTDKLTGYANLLKNSMGDNQLEILKDVFYIDCANNRFLIFDHMNDDTRMVFRTAITVYNHKSYTITMAGYYDYPEMMDQWDAIIESVSFSKPSKPVTVFGTSIYMFIAFTLILFVFLVAVLLFIRVRTAKKFMAQEKSAQSISLPNDDDDVIISSTPLAGLMTDIDCDAPKTSNEDSIYETAEIQPFDIVSPEEDTSKDVISKE
ncbi:MAG: hypothetical protein RRX95_00100 [Oscillospiraceae bacterium]